MISPIPLDTPVTGHVITSGASRTLVVEDLSAGTYQIAPVPSSVPRGVNEYFPPSFE